MENKSFADDFMRDLDGFVSGISLDCVVFGYRDGILNVLVLKHRNVDAWSLPGGFLPSNMEMQDGANDVLYQRTGLQDIFLTQYHTFSSLNSGSDSNEQSKLAIAQVQSTWRDQDKEVLTQWFHQRFISTAYLALIEADKASLTTDYLSEQCEWKPITDLPTLVLDHGLMIDMALKFLRIQINYLPIGKSLLPDKFTMSDLQTLYESILQKKLDRGNFQRKMLRLGILIRHEKLMTGASNKAPFLYSIDDDVYNRLLSEGFSFR